jgi:hypothetical protein
MNGGEARAALVAAAAPRSRVWWLSYRHPGGTVEDRLVWGTWKDGALLVVSVSGPEEQELPGIERASGVDVTMRSKDTGGRLVTWGGSVELVQPETESWDRCVDALLGVRLNLSDPGLARRAWAERGTVVRVNPLPASRDGAQDGALGALP